MGYYDDGYKDGLLFEIEEFLKNHPVSELLKIVAVAVYESKESE